MQAQGLGYRALEGMGLGAEGLKPYMLPYFRDRHSDSLHISPGRTIEQSITLSKAPAPVERHLTANSEPIRIGLSSCHSQLQLRKCDAPKALES